ncbi:GNAT family N-acetyltransferase [Brevibacillus laterosporus]|uniref:GNAT family N-acetyltransferase n=1 Tax=Brevibacillus laterosporus TaxID=1465 RepID=UPI0035A5FBB9
MAEGFMEDPLYQHILPDRSTRLNVLQIFFTNYVTMLYDYSDLYATSDRLEAVALVFRSEKAEALPAYRYMWDICRTIVKSLRASKYIGLRGFCRGLAILRCMSSAWLSVFEGRVYMHLDMLVVQSEFRGQGYVSKIMKPLLEECKQRNIVCTLETQNPHNIAIYERYQFTTIEVISLPKSQVEQYCMVYQ